MHSKASTVSLQAHLREKDHNLTPVPIPSVVKRPMKNINGDIVTDFTLTQFDSIRISGIVFEVDLATDDYKKKIRSHSKMLLDHIDESHQFFMLCRLFRLSTKFNPFQSAVWNSTRYWIGSPLLFYG